MGCFSAPTAHWPLVHRALYTVTLHARGPRARPLCRCGPWCTWPHHYQHWGPTCRASRAAIWCIPGVPGKHGGGAVLPRHAGTSYTMVVERRAGSSAPFRAPVHRSATRPNACCSGPAAAATPRNLWWRRAVPAATVAPVSAVTPDLGEPGGAAPGQATLGRRAVSPPSAARI